jgi:hypothetical protein
MPERAATNSTPFNRQERQIRQYLPRLKPYFSLRRANTVVSQQVSHIGGLRPQSFIFGEDP